MVLSKSRDAASRNVDDYIRAFPDTVQLKLVQMRDAIKKTAPQLSETIKYAIPTYTLHSNVVSFAAWKNILVSILHLVGWKHLKKPLICIRHRRVQ